MNKRKCDKCSRPATHHSVEILKGQKIEKHLCDDHAAEEGMAIKAVPMPINEMLTNFVKLHSGMAAAAVPRHDLQCSHCGLRFSQFRAKSLLGCPQCYDAFETVMGNMLSVAHDGGDHHAGKTPGMSAASQERLLQVLGMRKRLAEAVASEDYELAAALRDQISRIESEGQPT